MSSREKQLPEFWPENPPIYDIEKSYTENLDLGPFFAGEIPERKTPPKHEWIEFLGVPVASPIGVPAGPLLNSRWVTFAAQMGFDIVTYKTIRSRPHPAHPLPNMLYIDTKGAFHPDRGEEVLHPQKNPPSSLADLAATNSFGIPSKDRDYLVQDIAKAGGSLAPGQVMIVSVVGTPRPEEDFFEDFVEATRIALDGGAKIVEADLSCPNVASREGSLFTDPEAIYPICTKMKKILGSRPLIIKVGVIHEREVMRKVLLASQKAGVDGFCGINTVSRKIENLDGTPTLGEKRHRAGVCGGPIRPVALDFLQKARSLIEEEKLDLTLMGTGGVTEPTHFDDFFLAGADVAMSAVGMMWDPYLAARYHQKGGKRWK
ncbi:MAG: NAD-dependent dihydropyrimidine dehydrogenase subunit PreA [Chlamydiae bacterium]|nr:NAD-dependent dihydropyrimidine dehydrogenase subunit PreA [Chlamydiota bacterium]